MNESQRQKAILFFPFMVLFLGVVIASFFYIQNYRKIAFEHISAFCEIVLQNNPETESQLLVDLKDYHLLAEREINDNNFLKRYGYRSDEFCKGFSPETFLIPILVFCVVVCAFAFGILTVGRYNRKRISGLVEYLRKVNIGSSGTLIQTHEDEYSHLQDEIYKTVTALFQTREAAVNAKKNFAENMANIAHQLKTPITAAFLSLQLMKKDVDKKYADQIEKQLERLNQLEESLLTLSRIDAGTLPLKHEKVDSYTVLNLAAENLSDLLRENKICIEIPEKECAEFNGDLEWTMEALINLYKNCMEHSAPGETVHCDYSSNPLYTEIRIWDNGTGFDSEDLPHLFERFYRGRHSVGNGIGIGLALSKSIIEFQNGTIAAYNLPDGGACFEIRIYCH